MLTLTLSTIVFTGKIGDHKRALMLLDVMRAKGIKPSKLFKYAFIEFFRSNRIPLPAEFESDGSEVNASEHAKIKQLQNSDDTR